MERQKLKEYITEQYSCLAENPWVKYPGYEVFRHIDNKKWFAVIMVIPKRLLEPNAEGDIDIVNFKCDPLMIGSLRKENGFFPAYHMNKENWITVALDGSVSEDKILMLLDMSYDLTSKRKK